MEKEIKKLFLDDVRQVTDCITYMHSRIGTKNIINILNDRSKD